MIRKKLSCREFGGCGVLWHCAGNRLISMTDASDQTTTFGYNAADQRTSVTFPGAGKQTTTYDAAGRQTGITVTDTDGTTKFDTNYSYSAPDGSDTTLLQSRNINGTGNSYDYDALQRVTSSDSGAGSYGYDTASNITSGPNGTSYTTNAADQLTEKGGTSYDHDSAGNLTGSSDGASYEYSAANQLTGAQLPSGSIDKAVYDTADRTTPRSITETTGGNTVRHVFTHTAMGITSITDNGQRTGYFRDPAGKTDHQDRARRRALQRDHRSAWHRACAAGRGRHHRGQLRVRNLRRNHRHRKGRRGEPVPLQRLVPARHR